MGIFTTAKKSSRKPVPWFFILVAVVLVFVFSQALLFIIGLTDIANRINFLWLASGYAILVLLAIGTITERFIPQSRAQIASYLLVFGIGLALIITFQFYQPGLFSALNIPTVQSIIG